MKDFNNWNIQKQKIDALAEILLYREREIWWCRMGANIGYEQDGKNEEFMRPILILKGLGKRTLLIAPLTSSAHIHKYRVALGEVDGKSASVIVSQIKVIDVRRLVNKIGHINKPLFQLIQKIIKGLLF